MAVHGSGHFGSWITDEAGLPAYEYTCNHLQDPAAQYATRRGPSRDHFHLLGNFRASAFAHNEGYVEFFRPDTVGAWLNRYAPQRGAYAGGFGFLRIDRTVRSTLYRHLGDAVYRRVWGVGYFRKSATWGDLAIDQVTVSPYGDDPVLLSLTTFTNRGTRLLSLTYVEYWDVLVAPVLHGRGEAARIAAGLQVPRTTRYDQRHHLLLSCPAGTFAGPAAPPCERDPDPPVIFLAAIDGQPVAGHETSRAVFFGEGGLDAPEALKLPYLGCNTFSTPTRADRLILALQRDVRVAPRGRLTLAHLYGYGSWDSARPDAKGSGTPAGLVERYASRPAQTWFEESLENWRQSLIRFATPGEEWLSREAAWNSYYGQALCSFDAYTGEIYFDQGGCYTYDWGRSQTPRDFCQHALAFLPGNPCQVRGTIRHLTRMCRPNGSLSQAHAGHGRRDLTRQEPADLQLWLLWLIADYFLFYRDRAFADQEVPLYPQASGVTTTIRQQVRRGLEYLWKNVGRGSHGLLRLLGGDGNDLAALARGALGYWSLRKHGESTLASGVAGVALGRVAELCRWLGEVAWAQEIERWLDENRSALAAAWNGRWFDRILTANGEPIGRDRLFLDCQPWAILAGAAGADERSTLFREIRTRLDEPSPAGLLTLDPPVTDRGWPVGNGMNGGISWAANAPLVWALADDDPSAAWELLKKCTLAAHAEAYPEQWVGIWSGPDGFNSLAAARPGEPWEASPPFPLAGGRLSHRAFPIANAHSAGQLLFVLARLAGLEADARGYRLRPRLPLSEAKGLPFPHFTYEAARFGVHWEEGRVSGYIVPQGNDAVEIRVDYPRPLEREPRVLVDGRPAAAQLTLEGYQVSFKAFVRGGMRTEWEVGAE